MLCHNDSQQIPVHSLLKWIKLTHDLTTNCHAVQKNKHWEVVNTGFVCVVPVHPVCQFFRLKRHFYLRCSATMLLRWWQKSNFSTSLGTNPSGWRERSEELDRWSPLPPPTSSSVYLYFRFHIFPEKYSCCSFARLLVRELYFVWLTDSFLYKSFSSH